jgi:hypothetical protein
MAWPSPNMSQPKTIRWPLVRLAFVMAHRQWQRSPDKAILGTTGNDIISGVPTNSTALGSFEPRRACRRLFGLSHAAIAAPLIIA